MKWHHHKMLINILIKVLQNLSTFLGSLYTWNILRVHLHDNDNLYIHHVYILKASKCDIATLRKIEANEKRVFH